MQDKNDLRRNRINWVLSNENLWTNLDEMKVKAVSEGIYSAKLSNIVHNLECLIQQAKIIKRASNKPFQPLVPKTSLQITSANFDELIKNREVIDILCSAKHPVQSMDVSGFTYYDYAIYKRKEYGYCQQQILNEINILFQGGDIEYYR